MIYIATSLYLIILVCFIFTNSLKIFTFQTVSQEVAPCDIELAPVGELQSKKWHMFSPK